MSEDDVFEKLVEVYRLMLVVHRWQVRPTEERPGPAEIAVAMKEMEVTLVLVLRHLLGQRCALNEAQHDLRVQSRAIQSLAKLWCLIRETRTADIPTLRVVDGYAKEHGADLVIGWIKAAHAALGPEASDARIGRYISGIRRRVFDGVPDAAIAPVEWGDGR